MDTNAQNFRKKPTKLDEMTKEQIRQAILKKRECNTKAQGIVESLLEPGIADQFLLQCLPDINQSHFDDIIEERYILHLCGYPICNKMLSLKEIPKQKYRISLKTNKVYDITARKSFCSNTCYNAAMCVKKQLLTSPLWFREYEELPRFHLLEHDTIGSMGEEVDVALIQRVKAAEKRVFTTINDFAKASINDMSDDDDKQNKTAKLDSEDIESKYVNKDLQATDSITNDMKTKCYIDDRNENTDEVTESCSNNVNVGQIIASVNTVDKPEIPRNIETPINQKPTPNPLNIVGEIIEKPERKIDPILTTPLSNSIEKEKLKNLPQKKEPLVTALTVSVEKCLAEWFTLDTVLLLFGEEKVRELVAHKGECIKDYLNNYAKGIFYSSNVYDQYQALCRKLNMLELEDRKLDNQTLKRESKPLPDYRMLQDESKKMQLKVKAFFSGETDISKPINVVEEKPIDDNNDNVTNLPLVDKNSQNALRRRIVCQHLNKVLPDLLRSLGLLSLTISSDVRLLVNTFKLNSNNIMFKPIQWTLIAIIVIKLLSLRDKRLEYLLGQPTAYGHMQLLLLSYKQGDGYLDRLISWLTDIDRLLDTNDTQLTLE